jgi:cytochrome P450 family 12
MAFLRKVASKQLILRQNTRLSSVAAQNDVEWENAKPFTEIPGPKSFFEAVRKFMPGGAYYKKNMLQVNGLMRKEYGDLVMVPGILGRRSMVMTFSADDVEKVFRTEGHWPTRRGADVFSFYRQNVNKEVFGNVGGLIGEQGEDWSKFRTTVNPIMLQPKNVRLYVEKVDAVARDFIKIVKKLRDTNNETPGNFSDYLNRWSLESIGVIALDTRLGVLDEKSANERARTIIKVSKESIFLAPFSLSLNSPFETSSP